jgi:alpha-beta hydrolase superfamily lysophospholipase
MRENFKIKFNELININCYKWYNPDISPKAIVHISHGMAEHIMRYDRFAEELVAEGFVVFGEDHLGHGLTANSVEEIGYMDDVDNLQAMIKEIKLIIDSAKAEYPKCKVVQYGHSMGSLIAQRYIELYPDDLHALILSGTTAKSALHQVGSMIAGSIMKKHGRTYKSDLLDKMSFGSFNKPFKPARTAFDWLSTNPQEVDKYIESPYCGGIFSASFFHDFTKMIVEAAKPKHRNLIRKDLMIHMISGEHDPVSNNGKGVKTLYKQYKKRDLKVTYKLYEGARHELLNEVEATRLIVVNDVISFLNEAMK